VRVEDSIRVLIDCYLCEVLRIFHKAGAFESLIGIVC